MEAFRLFILKIILSSIILNIVLATSHKDKKNSHLQSTIANGKKQKINIAKTGINKKSVRLARSAFKRNWFKSYDANHIPPYLVFNRKTGSYYPYYTYPKENSIRRNSFKHSNKWSH